MSTPESRPEETPEPAAAPEAGATPEASPEAGAPEASSEPAPDGESGEAAAADARTDERLDMLPDARPDAMPDARTDARPDMMIDTGPAARDDDLRAAVGLPAQPERRGARPRGPRRRVGLIIGAIALLGAIVASLVILGRQNRARYYLACGEDEITAAQGQSFPPWGRSALEGKAWQAIARPLEEPCTDRVFESREALARSFGEMLVARVDAWVIAREDGAGPERLAGVQAELDQALRVLRELGDAGAGPPELSDEIQRLRGDLDYWQARARIDAAVAELARAAQHLDSAVAQGARHNREHAQAWQRVIARLQAELGAAPARTASPGAAAGAVPPGAAAGAALPPAEPGAPVQPGTDTPSVLLDAGPAAAPGSMSDAGPTAAPPVPDAAGPGALDDAPEPQAPDAGVRRGGLLI